MKMKTMFAVAAMALASVAAVAPAQAAVWTLNSTNGGDGFVTLGPPGDFTLFSSNNQVGSSLTTYTTVASGSGSLTYAFKYTTDDRDGSNFDPAGYVINGVLTQLSAANMPRFGSNSGRTTFTVGAGDTYGFYALATDSQLGRGFIEVAAVPEAGTWMLMIAGFGLVGVAARRRQAVVAA
jgi:hypothetical protein